MFIQPRELATHLLQDLKTLSSNDKESDISAGWKCASILIFFVRLLQPISWRGVYDIIKGQDVQSKALWAYKRLNGWIFFLSCDKLKLNIFGSRWNSYAR